MEKNIIDLSKFMKNPVILKNYDFSKPPIGKVEFENDKVFIIPRDKECAELIEQCNMNFGIITVRRVEGKYELIALNL